MIVHDVVQGSPEWQQLRAGRPTASNFHKIVTPAKCELSKQADGYMAHLLAERILGYPLDTISTAAMETGREREPEAAACYEFQRGVETIKIGICFTDDGRIGASPDRFVGEDGLLEIKCPNPGTHVSYLLAGASVSADYKPQVQGQLWITGRQYIDCMSFCHRFPEAVFRIERDDSYIAKLSNAVTQFADELDATLERLLALGCRLPEPREAEEYDGRFDVTDADVEAILAGKGLATAIDATMAAARKQEVLPE